MKATPPYDFIFDYLPDNVIVNRVFGMYYIYLNKKNMLILRKLDKNINLNGIWIATGLEHHASIKAEVPGITGFVPDNGKMHDSGWQLLPEEGDNFETAAIKICGLISHGDPRIGKITTKSLSL
ncbi:MAG TPA: hypothetical protein VK645_05270 [Chitinophagaceae bacterium]|nr:hypothetical protein [Chitinophagaceae bacterium]